MKPARQGQLAGLGAAVLFGCSAPLISTLTGSGSVLSIAGLLYAGATVALLAVRLIRGTRAETPVSRLDIPALAALTVLDGVVGPVALVLGPGPAAGPALPASAGDTGAAGDRRPVLSARAGRCRHTHAAAGGRVDGRRRRAAAAGATQPLASP